MKSLVIKKSKIKISNLYIQKKILLILNLLKSEKNLKNRNFLKLSEISIIFVSPIEMKKINMKYRGKNYSTDILSFESLKSKIVQNESIGELIFCPEILIKQARSHFLSLHREFDYLVIHGILHLLGYDHEKSKRHEKIMFSIQDRLFSQLTDY